PPHAVRPDDEQHGGRSQHEAAEYGQADGALPGLAAHWKRTGVPALTRLATVRTSQLVRRTQPWEAVLPIFSGSGVPWIPYCSLRRSIHTTPTGLLGPAGMVAFSFSGLASQKSFGLQW